MSFTYALSSPDPAVRALSELRLELGDTTAGMGVRPDGSNLSDAELQVWLNGHGGAVLPAAAAACEALSRMWATHADTTLGPRREALSQVAARWATAAERLEARVGGGPLGFGYPLQRGERE